MKRLLPLLATGCLWIGPKEQEARKASGTGPPAPIALAAQTLAEVSACDDLSAVAVEASVDGDWAGTTFQVWTDIAGSGRVDVAAVRAGPSVDGRSTLALVLDLGAAGDAIGSCTADCRADVTLGVESGPDHDEIIAQLPVLPASTPVFSQAVAVDGSGGATDLGAVPRDADDGISAVDFPTIAAGLDDPNAATATVSWLVCREGAATQDPADPDCTTLPADPSTAATGDVGWSVATADLALLTCDAADFASKWSLALLVEGHPCVSGDTVVPVLDPERWLGEDCDADGSLRGTDCADLDPAQFPGNTAEICGDDLDVDCDGLDGNGHISLADGANLTPYADLATAIAAGEGVTGAVIRVCGGTHNGPFVIEDDLAIEGWNGQIATLQGDGLTSVVKVNTGADVMGPPDAEIISLSHLILQGGGGDIGAGLNGKADGLSLTDVTVTGNTAANFGGGLLVAGTVTLTDVEIYGNTSGEAGGLGVVGGTVTADQLDVHDNSALSSGGGILVRDGSLIATNATVTGNDAPSGAGVSVDYTQGPPPPDTAMAVSGLDITSNTGGGAGLFVNAIDVATDIAVSDVTVSDHTVAGDGGGVRVDGDAGVITFTNLQVTDNTATRGGGLFSEFAGTLTLFDGSISANDAVDRGGGLYLAAGTVVFDGTIDVSNNVGDLGGGIASAAPQVELVAMALVGNVANTAICAPACVGGGGLLVEGGTVYFAGDILENNSIAGLYPGAGARVAGTGALATCGGAAINNEVANDEGAVATIPASCTVTNATGTVAAPTACSCP
jgi:predicted outer membrane repeat protein